MRQPSKNVEQAESSQTEGVLNTDWITNLDIMGEKFKFQYTKTTKAFKTRFGGIVTLVVSIISILALVFISSQYFDTSSPVVTTTRELSRSSQGINLYGKDILLPYSISSRRTFEPLKMNNFMTVIGQIIKKNFDPLANSSKISISKQFNYIPCPQITEDQSLLDLFKMVAENTDIRAYLCPNFKEINNNVTLSYDPDNLSSTSVTIKVYPCSLPDFNDCFPVQKVFGSEFTMPLAADLISPSNFEKPIEDRLIVIGQLVDLTRAKSLRYIVEENKIYDDRQIFGKPKLKTEYFVFRELTSDTWGRDFTQMYCTPKMIDSGECEEYIELVFEINNEAVVTTRRYKKIPALMGEFGGILKLLSTVFVILSFYYSVSIKSFLFRKVFGIEKSKAKRIMKRAALSLSGEIDRNQEKVEGRSQVIDPDLNQERGSSRIEKDKNKSQKRVNFHLKKALEDAVNSKTNITELVKKMDLVNILKNACLEEHHQTLLPLVLLKSEQSQKEVKLDPRNSKSNLEFKSIEKETEFDSCFSGNKDPKEQQQGGKSVAKDQPSGKKSPEKLLDDRNCFNELKKATSRNSLDRIFHKELLCLLSVVYEHD